MKPLTYATVCSGIECMSVACRGLPLKPVFFSEIEPFPCAVLKAHYPDVPNLGDMSKIQVSNDGKEITNGTIRLLLDSRLDILAGGTPCQDVSVAGKRAGMQEGSGTRSSLAFEFVRLARELGPRYIIWENVAGAIDSKNAPDFLAFLRALGDCGYSIAWRVLDAQYVTCSDIYASDGRVDVPLARAVPQRRRRVWVVGVRSLGCAGADESVPAQILFEPDCVAGHTAPRRRTGEGFAYSLAGRDRVDARLVGETAARATGGGGRHDVSEPLTLHSHIGARNGEISGPFVAETIDANYYKGQGSRQGVERPVAVQCYENNTLNHSEVCRTLSGNHDDRVTDTGTSVVHVDMAQNTRDEGERWDEREVAQTRNTFDNGEKRCQEVVVSTNSNGGDVAATVNANMSKLGGDNQTTFGGGGMSLVAVGIGHDAYNSGRNAKMGMSISSEVEPTMKSKSDGCGAVAIAREGVDGE